MTPLAPSPADLMAAAPIPRPPQGLTRAQAETVARDFEAMALSQMFQSMWDGVGEPDGFGGGAGERAFRPLLLQEYAAETARAGGVSIADAVLAEMLRLQTSPAEGAR